MTKKEKLRQKLTNNPNNVRIGELQSLMEYYGFSLARVRGSHHTFRHDTLPNVVLPVHQGKIKSIYVKRVLELLNSFGKDDDTISEDNDEENTNGADN